MKMTPPTKKHGFLILTLIAATAFGACAGSRNTANMTMKERIAYAKKKFDEGDYFEAKTQFQILVLNNPGSSIVDVAQYYLAESYFQSKEYITAAAEFEKLVTIYPHSEYRDDAQFKLAKCYFELSPPSQLDQEYTIKAIDLYQLFLEEYPNSEHVKEAEADLQACREKLAKKEFETGEQYKKRQYYISAIISFEEVLARYYDTSYVDDALYWKAYSHYQLGEYREARDALQLLLNKYPDSPLRSKAVKLGTQVDQAMSSNQS